MLRIFLVLIISIGSFFGVVFVTEHRNPSVKKLTAEIPVDPENGTKLHSNGVPDQVMGTFALIEQSSAAWLNSAALSEETKTYFAQLHTKQKSYSFDGSSLWFGNSVAATPVEVLEIGDKLVKFKLLETPLEHKGSTTFYLQWDDNGYVWLSNNSHMEKGKMQLYRACYKKTADK